MSDNRETGTGPLGLAGAAALLGNFDESGLNRIDGGAKETAERPEANEPGDNDADESLLNAAEKIEADEEGENGEEPGEEAEESDEDTDAEPGEEDENEETDEESEQQAATLDDDTEVDVDGRSVKLSELRSGYLRQSDYTRKTQALADERKSLESAKAEAERARGSYTEQLQVLGAFLQKSLPYDEAALEKLAEEDPAAYLKADRANRKHVEALQAIHGEMKKAHEDRARELAEARRKAAEEGRKRLPEVIPEWRDPKVFKREAGEVAQYLKSHGRSDEEIAGITDPGIVALVRKAWLYDQGQQAKATVKAKKTPPKAAPAPSKVQKPNAAKEPGHQKVQQLQKLRKDLKKAGSRNDKFAAAARYMTAKGL